MLLEAVVLEELLATGRSIFNLSLALSGEDTLLHADGFAI